MAYLPLLAALAFVLSPIVSGSFGGFDPQAFPVPQDDPPVQPAGWAFAIWGVIYLALLAHTAIGATIRRNAPEWRAARLPLTVSLAVGAAWIPVANASPVWATVLILVMLGTAVLAYIRAPSERLVALWPLGLYAGWLLAASAVSLGLLAAGYGLTGEVVAAALALVLAVILGFQLMRARRSAALPVALGWAFAGIAAQNWDESLYVLCLAAAASTIMAVRAVRAFLRP
ncbi:TspO/MBR related protein [Palleronia aestuarii]|uniref:TspO/MBR related protein n=1 Tax=Palleronia aestuarii TaxID=568105 RepID=A0A2W7NC93_9RHOB|nr:tryptophan-rich sensory protein [Palleronia aestuarii]PZX17600.1 TspO/MBR related protein [Palleronia aestuarii]